MAIALAIRGSDSPAKEGEPDAGETQMEYQGWVGPVPIPTLEHVSAMTIEFPLAAIDPPGPLILDDPYGRGIIEKALGWLAAAAYVNDHGTDRDDRLLIVRFDFDDGTSLGLHVANDCTNGPQSFTCLNVPDHVTVRSALLPGEVRLRSPELFAWLQEGAAADDFRAGPRVCAADRLALSHGQDLSPPTGRALLAFVLTNRSTEGCVLSAPPNLVFEDQSGNPLLFVLRFDGGGQVVNGERGRPLLLQPGGASFLTIEKYRCDRGNLETARVVRLSLGNLGESTSLALPDYPLLGYCGSGDGGSIIAVSPFGATYADTVRPLFR